MSAGLPCVIGQRLGVHGLIEEGEAGGCEETVALGVHRPHQHIVHTWERERETWRMKASTQTDGEREADGGQERESAKEIDVHQYNRGILLLQILIILS